MIQVSPAGKVYIQVIFSRVFYLGFAEQLLQLMLGQQAVVLHKGRDLWGSLGLVVHCSVDLHVSVEDLQETVFPLLEEEQKQENE